MKNIQTSDEEMMTTGPYRINSGGVKLKVPLETKPCFESETFL